MFVWSERSIKVSPPFFLAYCALGSLDLLIDKQDLVRNKVLKTNGLCGSDIMDVSVGRQFEGKIFGFRKKYERTELTDGTAVH